MGGGARGGKSRTRGPRVMGAGSEVFTEGWRPESAIDDVKGDDDDEEGEDGRDSEDSDEDNRGEGPSSPRQVETSLAPEGDAEEEEEASGEEESEDGDEGEDHRRGYGLSGEKGSDGIPMPLAMWVSKLARVKESQHIVTMGIGVSNSHLYRISITAIPSAAVARSSLA